MADTSTNRSQFREDISYHSSSDGRGVHPFTSTVFAKHVVLAPEVTTSRHGQ